MLVSEMQTWSDLWEATKDLSALDRGELARFLNLNGVADEIEVLDRQLVDLDRGKAHGIHHADRAIEAGRYDVASDRRARAEIEDSIDELIQGALSAWQTKADEPLDGLSDYDCDAIQAFLDLHAA